MANPSIYAAFERMWQHITAKLGTKADKDHTHNDFVSDWNQNDPEGVGYIQNRTHWADTEQSYVTIVDNQRSDKNFGIDCSIVVSGVNSPLIEGNKYLVTFDGTDYPCVAYYADGYISLGDSRLLDGDTDVNPMEAPFCLQYGEGWTEVVGEVMLQADFLKVWDTSGEANSHTVTVKELTETLTYHKLDLNYIPDEVALKSDIGSGNITVDSTLSATSTNPVQNKVVNEAINSIGSLVGDAPVSEQIESATGDCITGLSASGKKITYTKGDGSTGTITTQDTDTTYSEATTTTAGLMSSSDKTKLDGIAAGAEVNQNTFGKVKIGSTTITADAKTDTLTLVAGDNVTLTPDATNDKITISATNTDTTYSAGTGISLSGTTFSNSGVRSISTGSSNGTISVNTNGTSANVAVKGLGSAAYTASTAYDAAGSASTALTNAKAYTDTAIAGVTPATIGAFSTNGGTITGDLTLGENSNTSQHDLYIRRTIEEVLKSARFTWMSDGYFRMQAASDGSIFNYLDLKTDSTVFKQPVSISSGGTGSTNGATGLNNLLAAGKTVLSSYQYGTSLPAAGTAGRIFFKKVSG